MFLDREKCQSQTEHAERGSVLMSVIAVMAVTLIIALVVASTTIQALGFTSATRAGVQSEAAAVSGIDAALMSVLNNSCAADSEPGRPGVLKAASIGSAAAGSSYSARYQVTVKVRTGAGAFLTGCPSSSATAVKLISEGTASAKGVAGNTTNDTHKVEALYTSAAPSGGGAAIYSYVAGNISNVTLSSAPGVGAADVFLKTGGFLCNRATIPGNVLLEGGANPDLAPFPLKAGEAYIGDNCRISGSLWAPGNISFNNGTVGGDVFSGRNVAAWSNRVTGFIHAAGTISDGNPARNRPNTPYAPPRTVPDWQDFTYVPAQWTDAGYTGLKDWVGAGFCDASTNTVGVKNYLEGLTANTVIDARGCPALLLNNAGLNIRLRADIAFIAPGLVKLENGLRVSSADGAKHHFLILTPDANPTANRRPDKPAVCTDDIKGSTLSPSVTIEPEISALVYTPCTITNTHAGWRGQFYGGRVDVDSSVSLVFDTPSVPGLDLSGGGGGGGAGAVAAIMAQRTYLRDLDG